MVERHELANRLLWSAYILLAIISFSGIIEFGSISGFAYLGPIDSLIKLIRIIVIGLSGYLILNYILNIERLFAIIYLGTFNKLGGANLLMKGGDNLNKKDFLIGVLLIFILLLLLLLFIVLI